MTVAVVKPAVGNLPQVQVKGVNKHLTVYGRHLAVLRAVDLHVDAGEFVSIIGPSGCGKSTLLNILAGLEQPSQGSIFFQGRPAIHRLGLVGYMQQKDLLLPWRTVLDNVLLGLEVRGVARRAARARAMALMAQFGLQGFEKVYPAALSGGMRQRAAFLRTVLADQDVFLLDEPFGALDALSRPQMHAWLLELWATFHKTIVLVTHDVDEAIFLSDRVYVMTPRPGHIHVVQPVALPRPRHLAMLTEAPFVALKSRLLAALRSQDTGEAAAESP